MISLGNGPVHPFRVREYVDRAGTNHFRTWLDTLDTKTKARIQARILRTESGNLGDHKPVGGGVSELRVDFGPGYRVYFGIDGTSIVLLLTGGDKSSQRKDIDHARSLWSDFLKGDQNGQKK